MGGKSNKKKVETFKKMKIVPTIISMFVLLNVLMMIATSVVMFTLGYMERSKLHDASVDVARIEKYIQAIDYSDTVDMEQQFSTMKVMDKDLCGISLEKDGKILFSEGTAYPNADERMKYEDPMENMLKDTNYTIYYSTTGNCELYIGSINKFNFRFSMDKFKDFLERSAASGSAQIGKYNEPLGYQDIWTIIPLEDGAELRVGHTIVLTDYDYQLAFIGHFQLLVIAILLILFMFRLVVRICRSQNKMSKLYYRDTITGGTNWAFFEEKVSKTLTKNYARGISSIMIQFRMEKYHNYITVYGEEEGKNLLHDIYEVARAFLPKESYLCRYDGADFAIVLQKASIADIEAIIKGGFEKLKNLRPNISTQYKCGIYQIRENEKITVIEAYNKAAIARKAAEEDIATDIMFFNSKMQEDIYWEKKVENDFEQAIKNHEFLVYLQPKYSVVTEKPVAAEALVRWQHPTEGFLGPYKFIPIFEKNGMIRMLDDYMIESVAKIQADAIRDGYPLVPISVNLSRVHFTNENLAEHICELVDKYEVPHSYIELELTESAFFDDREMIIRTANRLRDYGFAVSLDDFGAGYSSLNSLRELPIDIVKLDAGFFRGQELDGKGQIIVKEIISLAKQLDIQIVAEGIETKEQVDFLSENKCDLIQGFYYAKPMPVEEFSDRMRMDTENLVT